MPGIALRDAIIEDAAVIATLLDELGYPSQPDGVRGRLARLLAGDGSRVFVAERAAKVVGVLALHRMPVLTSLSDVAMIIALVVTERERRAGVGRLLIARAEDEARVWQCGRIMVTSAERRADAHAFYQHLGYEYTGRRFAKVMGL
ncbi:MAG TPA: GNAT family N-acetyltransferase [Gemmatimonadaceae bacterium]|nr:GNAT family N-acetyltransferase [Gemmatimonadaceae bacterium]